MINEQTAAHLVETAADAIRARESSFHQKLDELPAAIYVTDPNGTITYFSDACVKLAGRQPKIGIDKWCVTWRIFTTDGEYLPHDRCPMAVAIREQRSIRDVEAIAERPDGERIIFMPFPTPVFDAEGNLMSAVNLLLDVTEQRTPEYLKAQANKSRRLARTMTDPKAAETLFLLAVKYDEQALKYARLGVAASN
jgi:PAS domain S-box-containing protein